MNLCIKGIDFASFCDFCLFSIVFFNVPTVWYFCFHLITDVTFIYIYYSRIVQKYDEKGQATVGGWQG